MAGPAPKGVAPPYGDGHKADYKGFRDTQNLSFGVSSHSFDVDLKKNRRNGM